MIKILIVEDDKNILNTLTYYLQNEGFSVKTAQNIHKAIDIIKNEQFNIVLLDITLPDGNGYDFYKKLKEKSNTPVIFLTALDEEKDIVKGFDSGADDYITKPFHTRELLSRIKNVLRHTENKNIDETIKIKDVEIKKIKKIVKKGSKEIELTALEYKILLLLFENKGGIISREQILANIWDENENFVNDNTLTVYIKRIREKIENNANKPEIIKTIRGIGYKIET